MATAAVVVTGQLPTNNGNYVDFTSTDFGTPDAAIVITSNANTTNNPQVNANYSVGFWTASGQSCATVASVDALDTTKAVRKTQNGDVLLQLSIDLVSPLTLSTLTEISAAATTNGIRLTKDTGSSSAARYATVVLIKGCLNEYLGSVNLGTGTDPINVTSPGFRADLVFALTVGAGNDTGVIEAIFSFGAAQINASDTVSQGLIAFSSKTAQADTDVDTMVRDDAIACQNFNGTLSWKASIGAHSSGFTITPSANASSDIVYYLALELADPDDAYVAIKDTITGTGDQAYTGAGFTPTALILGQTMCTAVNTNTTQGYFGIGAGGPASVEQSLGVIDENAKAASDSESYADLSNIVNIRSEVGSVDTIASLSSLDADGWTLNYSDGSASVRKMLAIAIGNSSAGGITGTLSASESGSDTASISGDVLVNGTLAATESGADSVALVGKVFVEGTLSASESGADTAALAGDVLVKGALAAAESGNDTALFVGEGASPAITGTLAASESGSDTASIAGKVYIAGTLSAVEGGLDGFAASGNILVQGTLAASETGDDTAAFVQETLTLTPADLNAIAAAVWADPAAVAAHAKLDEIIARITC